MRYIFIFLLKVYQYVLSPLFPPSCRFYPTCSNYALQAFKKHPWYKALYLTVVRLSKCHPFHPGGYDPVP